MLKAIAIGVACLVVFLAVVDRASLFLPPCNSITQHTSNNAPSQDDYCSERQGIIIAGVQSLYSLPPEGWTAIATIVIASFTITLWLATSTHASHIEKMLVLARDEFNSTHRPLLRVRNFRCTRLSKTKLQIKFTVINVGTGPGWLIGDLVQADFFHVGRLPVVRYEEGQSGLDPRKFEAGASDEMDIASSWSEDVDGFTSTTLHVYGYLVYKDALENTRTTAFCRHWDKERGRFFAVDDPDYEYED